jgi:mRNA deadenylase 3'-5' endonuclease subunit Ccr4
MTREASQQDGMYQTRCQKCRPIAGKEPLITKLIIWNTQWAKPDSKREIQIKKIVAEESPDIICITEGYMQSWEHYEHIICSQEDYGYKIHEGRRKVILLSKEKWTDKNIIGNDELPTGRFISGVTSNTQVVGVCIPWKDAHVKTGNKNSSSWGEHLSYLSGLKTHLDKTHTQTIVVGDYNQRIPKKYSTKLVFDTLLKTFENFDICSTGIISPIGKQSIDHFSTNTIPENMEIKSIDNIQNNFRLSDHFGLIITW